MLAYFESALSWRDLVARTAREVSSDVAQGVAAQLAYYFFLALFPALLCLLAIASFFPLQHFTDNVARLLAPVAPPEMIALIRQQMVRIAEGQHGGLLTLGLVGAIWTSSGAMVAVVSAMNRAYDIDESRPWWQVRLTAILLTIGLAVFIIVAFTLIVAGPQLVDTLAGRIGLGSIFVWSWKILQWPVAFVLVSTGFGLIYYFAPDAEQEWVWITTYGTLGGIILLLLWFYLAGLVIVIGAEMNAEIEHASPWGKAPGEKIPGAKKKLGAAAARQYRDDGQMPRPQSRPVPLALPAYEPPSVLARAIAYVAVIVRWKQRAH
jgi:membrane protein